MSFNDWRIVITGGSSGIGLATGVRFRERGAKVVSLDLRKHDEVEGIDWEFCDVADDSSVQEAVDAAVEGLGGLDVLVNNAGSRHARLRRRESRRAQRPNGVACSK